MNRSHLALLTSGTGRTSRGRRPRPRGAARTLPPRLSARPRDGQAGTAFASSLGRACAGAATLDEIELGAHLHDVGKYLIAKSILLKPGPLDEGERAAVSFHPVYGAQLLSNLTAITDAIRRVVLYHHEHWDGEGYPEGLQGTVIPLGARLVAVADVYTSLRARRAYKPTLTRGEAAAEMKEMDGRELDPEMTRDFLKFIRA
jgi:HD-GYP domain-containing protein (c-di-GMP phosphodiesterase class II)